MRSPAHITSRLASQWNRLRVRSALARQWVMQPRPVRTSPRMGRFILGHAIEPWHDPCRQIFTGVLRFSGWSSVHQALFSLGALFALGDLFQRGLCCLGVWREPAPSQFL